MRRPVFLLLFFSSSSFFACAFEARDGAAQDACSAIVAAYCEGLAECDGSVDEAGCVAADDALGGACATATKVELDSDPETCAQVIADADCELIEDRTAPGFQVPCVQDVSFEE